MGCDDLTFGVSDFGPFARNSILPVQGDSVAEAYIFRYGNVHVDLDYGALRRYADPTYCSPTEVNCNPALNRNRFRTLRIEAGLGQATVLRFALWQTPKTSVSYRQVGTARDVPVPATGPYTFELRDIIAPALLTNVALDDRNDYMLTVYVPDASQRDVNRNRVCSLRFEVTGKSFGN